MTLIKSIRNINAAIRPKLKHLQLSVETIGKQEQFLTKVKITVIIPKKKEVIEPIIHTMHNI